MLGWGLCGCSALPWSGTGGRSGTSNIAGAPPRVQDCGIVSISSPTKYACNGKVYTTFELVKLREDWTKNHGG